MPDLNCTEFEARLQHAVEHREPLGEESAEWQELRGHAHVCTECRRQWNEFALLESVLPVWKEQVPAVQLADAVMSRWQSERENVSHAEKKTVSHNQWSRFVAMAAAVLVLIAGGFWVRSWWGDSNPADVSIAEQDKSQAPVVVNNPPKSDSPEKPTVEEEADWRTLAQEASNAYWVLASETADSFASASVFVSPPQPTKPAPAEKSPAQAAAWGEGIGTGLKPIGKDVSRAVGFLFDAFPGDGPTL